MTHDQMMRTPYDQIGEVPTFTLGSTDVKNGEELAPPQRSGIFGAGGTDTSPELHWSGFPAGTKSFAVTVFDPDAPTGSGWWHWVVFNLPPDTRTLLAGAGNPASGKLPKGAVQSLTDFGVPGYGGPCPPKSDRPHRYVFTVHALEVEKLDLDEKAMPAMVGFMITTNRIDKATFTSTYSRK